MADTDTMTIPHVSQQLDLLIVRYFQTLADLFQCKQLLENDMKDGFFYMAKARYSMGNTRVGKLQYDDRDLDCALVHVDIHTPSDSDHSYWFHPCINIPQSSTEKLTETEVATEENRSSVNDLEPTVSLEDFLPGLRKRNVFPTDGASDSDGAGNETLLVDEMKKLIVTRQKPKKDDHDSKCTATQDPLHWFGILVPMSLRHCQSAFRHSIDVVCKIASLQAQLLDIREQYCTTLKAKHRLSRATADVENS